MNIKSDEHGTISKLINFESINNLDTFINELITKFKKSKKYIIDNPKFNFNDKLCICNIKKQSIPNWNSKCTYITNTNEKNTTHYRIVMYKYTNLILYIEKNGQIKILDKILEKYKNIIDTEDKLDVIIDNYYMDKILNKSNVINFFNEHYPQYYQQISNNNTSEYTLTNFINLYYDLINNKKLDDDKKLDSYIYEDCIDYDKNGFSTETMYNKLICKNYPEKYINLDIKTIYGCEIADIYDIKNNLLFHNKKNKDLRLFSCQVFIGALLLKDENKGQKLINFIDTYKIDVNNFKYVFGIIQEKDNITLTYPHQISIGNTCHILKKLNIDYFVDFIKYIKK